MGRLVQPWVILVAVPGGEQVGGPASLSMCGPRRDTEAGHFFPPPAPTNCRADLTGLTARLTSLFVPVCLLQG